MIAEQNLNSKFAIFARDKQKIYINPDMVTFFTIYENFRNPRWNGTKIHFGHEHYVIVDETIEEVLKILSKQ